MPVRKFAALVTFALGTIVQEVPFQCSTRVPVPGLGKVAEPTAQTSADETAATLVSMLVVNPKLGLGMMVQCCPSQCSVSVGDIPPLEGSDPPTAQISDTEMALTLLSRLMPGALGLETICQAVPFQCSMRVSDPGLV